MTNTKFSFEDLKQTVIFLMSFIIILSFLNIIYINFVLIKKAEYRKQMAYEQFINLPNKTLDFAFFGSSHTNDGVNPTFISNSYNYGGGGKG